MRAAHDGWSWTPAWSYDGAVTVWRLDPSGTGEATRYLKVRHVDDSVPLAREAAALRWAAGRLAVPRVLDAGRSGPGDWLLTEALPGTPATAPALLGDPAAVVPALARGLRRFHDGLPVAECPFSFGVGEALAHVRRRVAEGRATADDLHPEFAHLGVDGALAELDRLTPADEDLVVCHGDYCFPNLLLEGGEVTGYLDLGELGVADRWWDVAVGSWSTTWNVGPGWEEAFLEAYGVEADPDRMRFFRLLYDLVS